MTRINADVVVTDVTDLDISLAIRALEENGLVVAVVPDGDQDQILAAAHSAFALIVGYATVSAELLSALPALRIVATMSAGFDMVDVETAARLGIAVTNIPAAATEEVAVHAIAGMLSLLRCLPQGSAAVTAGEWSDTVPPAPPRPSTLTLGLLGFGKIGRRVAALAGPFFASVIAHDPWLPAGTTVSGVELVTLDELAARSNVLSLHAPLTAENRHIIDRGFLAAVPAASYLVNVARGALVDEAALVAALADGQIAGASLDVLEAEPPAADHPLLGDPRVIITPHSAYRSIQSLEEYVLLPVRNILAVRATGQAITPIPEGLS